MTFNTMKFVPFFLVGFIPLGAAPHSQDELSSLLELIETTKSNLAEQQRLLKHLLEFKKTREYFVGEPNNPKLATELVRAAMRLHSLLKESRVIHLFSSDFLSELSFFNEVGEKHQLTLKESGE